MKRKRRQCPYCQAVVLDHRMLRHLDACAPAGSLGQAEKISSLIARRVPGNGSGPLKAGQSGSLNVESSRQGGTGSKYRNVELRSKRGTRTPGKRACSKCDRVVLETFRYAESNRGTVHLCHPCRVRLHPGHLAGLIIRPYQGGAF